MQHLLLCVALLTGIALVFLDLNSMQFPTFGFHRSRLALELLCRLGVCFRVITERVDWKGCGRKRCWLIWGTFPTFSRKRLKERIEFLIMTGSLSADI